MRQVLHKINFYLRKSNVSSPTLVYCGVRVDGILHKISTGTKVKPAQWSKEHQLAITSNLLNKIDNYNNEVVNKIIEEYRERFTEYLIYLCSSVNETYNINDITEYLTGMAKIKASDLIESAFNQMYPEPKAVVGRNDTRRVNLGRLKSYLEYLNANNLTKLDVFKQAGVLAYQRYLTNIGDSASSVNNKVELIARLINKVLAVEEPFIKYGIAGGIVVVKKADKRPEKGRFTLNPDELYSIAGLKLEADKKYSYSEIIPTSKNNIKGDVLEEYRDIFILQCTTGQRVSDLEQLIKYIIGEPTDKVKQVEVEGLKYFEVKTKKSQGKESALVLIDGYLGDFIAKYSKKKFSISLDNLDSGKFYNYAIRMLAKFAGIDRQITYRNAQDEEITEPAYLKLTSHCARHTFITNKLRAGISPVKLCYLTGHSDDKMIKTTYSHLTSTDKARMVGEELVKVGAIQNPPTQYNTVQPKHKEAVDYDRLLGKIGNRKGRLGDIAKWLIDNDINIDTLIGYYQKLNPDSINKVGDMVVRADMMMSRLLTIRDIIQGS